MQDVRRFHQSFYESKIKVEQDSFLLRYVKPVHPKRHRIRKPGLNATGRGMSVNYYFPCKIPGGNRGLKQVKVCRKAFLDVLNISPYRIKLLCKRELAGESSPVERRGGDRKSKKFEPQLVSVKK